jgi:hypothetical protein
MKLLMSASVVVFGLLISAASAEHIVRQFLDQTYPGRVFSLVPFGPHFAGNINISDTQAKFTKAQGELQLEYVGKLSLEHYVSSTTREYEDETVFKVLNWPALKITRAGGACGPWPLRWVSFKKSAFPGIEERRAVHDSGNVRVTFYHIENIRNSTAKVSGVCSISSYTVYWPPNP